MQQNKIEGYNKFVLENGLMNETKAINEIIDEFNKIDNSNIGEDILVMLKWDYELLSCCEIPIERREEGQKFLFPQIVFTSGIKFPDIDNFEEERLSFYENRLRKVSNKHVKIRYLNYLVDFDKKKNRYYFARELCDELYSSIESQLQIYNCLNNISRIIEIALRFKLQDTIMKLDSMINKKFEKDYEHEDDIWLLELSRIIVRSNTTKRTFLEQTTIDKIIKTIQNLSEYYYDLKQYYIYQQYCWNLVELMRNIKNTSKEHELLNKYGEAFIKQADNPENTNLARAHFLECAMQHYINIGEQTYVYDLKVKIKEAYRLAKQNGEYKTISTTMSLSKEELADMIDPFWNDDINQMLLNISYSKGFIPDKLKLKKESDKLNENSILNFVSTTSIYGNRKVFQTENDEDTNNIIFCRYYNLALETHFGTVYSEIWNRMKTAGLKSDIVINRICNCKYINDNNKEVIKIGIERLFDDDYISCLHILVPQFENLFRTFFEWGGFATTSVKIGSIQHEQNFNDFIRNQYVIDNIEPDLLYMIDFIMVNNIGYNLRNNIAHGLAELSTYRIGISLMVLYLFFMMTNITWKNAKYDEE